jgi:hypothetical protein
MTSQRTTGTADQDRQPPRQTEARSYRPAPSPRVPGTKAKPSFVFTDWASI